MFFILIYVTLYSVTSFKSTDSLLEIFVTLGSLVILFLIISPSLLLLFDTDITILPNTILCILGMQWAWESTIKITNASSLSLWYCAAPHSQAYDCSPCLDANAVVSFPLNTTSSYLIIPYHSIIKTVVGSRDVIHSYGVYSFGCKIDAIPGRFNLAFSIKPLIRGIFRGFCFELCGTNHTSMIINCLSL